MHSSGNTRTQFLELVSKSAGRDVGFGQNLKGMRPWVPNFRQGSSPAKTAKELVPVNCGNSSSLPDITVPQRALGLVNIVAAGP